jgi:hypothetical protein
LFKFQLAQSHLACLVIKILSGDTGIWCSGAD